MNTDQKELNSKIERYLDVRRKIKNVPNETALKELRSIKADLDKIFWNKAADIFTRSWIDSADPGNLGEDDRLLVNAGLLDRRLIYGYSNDLRAKLLKDLLPDMSMPVYYFSEWLYDRYRNHILINKSAIEGNRLKEIEDSLSKAEESYQSLLIRQNEIYLELAQFINDLPGISDSLKDYIITGRMDRDIEILTYKINDSPDPALLKNREKMESFRRNILEWIKARAAKRYYIEMVDELEELKTELISHGAVQYRESKRRRYMLAEYADEDNLDTAEERKAFLKRELSLIKHSLPLGSTRMESRDTFSTLYDDIPHMTRSAAFETSNLVRECDPAVPGEPYIVITPSCGVGFFDWDNNSIVLPIRSDRPFEESAAMAFGNYRMLVDMLYHDGKLAGYYSDIMGNASVGKRFIKDYVEWVIGVGRGKKALDERTFKFFRSYLGPEKNDIVMPRELVNLSPKENKELFISCQKKREEGSRAFNTFYYMGVLLWERGRLQDSRECMETSVSIKMDDGRACYSLACILRALSEIDAAKASYIKCMAVAPRSIWKVFAEEELRRMV